MSSFSSPIKKAFRKAILYLIDEATLRMYLITFVVVIVLLAALYEILTPYGQGLALGSIALTEISFRTGLYFSVITISSLGYGDFQPVGISRFLACAEVLFGLAFMGLLIARITSRRLTYHVERLFSSDIQRRLDAFSKNFDRAKEEFNQSMELIRRAYQQTPTSQPVTDDQRDRASVKLQDSVRVFQSHSKSLAVYLSNECDQGKYFSLAPIDTVVHVGKCMSDGFFMLGQLILSLPVNVRPEVIEAESRRNITQALETGAQICRLVEQNSSSDEVLNCYREISKTSTKILEQFFSTPLVPSGADQPDQSLQDTDDPIRM